MAEGRWLDDTGYTRPRAVPTLRSDRLGRWLLLASVIWTLPGLALPLWAFFTGEAILFGVWLTAVYVETEPSRRTNLNRRR